MTLWSEWSAVRVELDRAGGGSVLLGAQGESRRLLVPIMV